MSVKPKEAAMPNRRTILQLLALGSLAAVPAVSAASRSETDPAAAWRNPGAGQKDPRLYSLAHAILAPNPHNRQPWLVSLEGEDSIILYFDTNRRLPATDPYDRQLAIGCGAFLEVLSIAAREVGYEAQIRPFPMGEPQPYLNDEPFAHIRLIKGGTKDPLYGFITQRRSNKEPYDIKKHVSAESLQALLTTEPNDELNLAGTLSGTPQCESLRQLTIQAYRREIETPLALKESIDLMRIGKGEIAQYRDGIDLDFPGIGAMQAMGLLTREKMMTPGTKAYQQGLEQYDPLAKSASGYVWIISNSKDRFAELAAGRAYARLNLRAAALGIAMHPMSQALQEYAEMSAIKANAEKAVGLGPDKCLQMLARIGYGGRIPPSPRRGLQEHLRT
ncbi:MAG: twin-arginine translocation pathway signal protein [Alphaproteobacteria bacterium PA3]|nr:MAG: twin-arginine translocation pathway signal protein [Alphaproteobacteria bacterium PA3]